MSRLVLLRCKQLWRLLPWVLAAAVLLSLCAAAAGGAMVQLNTQSDKGQKYRVALCATEEDPLLKLGVEALKTLDDTRFSVELLMLEESAARQALRNGELDAFVILPEGFLQSALHGDVPTIPFVTTPGGSAVGQLFREQITGIIADLLLSAQKGSYGAYFALADNGLEELALAGLNELCLEYILLALNRGSALQVQILGVGSGVDLLEYLTCGLTVTVIFLLCLPFTSMLACKDTAVHQMLAAKGCPVGWQALADFICPAAGMCAVTACVFAVMALAGLESCVSWLDAMPVALLAAAMSYFVCAWTAEHVSGVLAQFALAAGMCFVSGCLYPVYFFPPAVQEMGKWLPAGICREFLCGCVTENGDPLVGWLLAGFTVCFVLLGIGIRSWRILAGKEGRA